MESEGNLLKEVEESFKIIKHDTQSEEIDMGHGRVEKRKCTVINDLQLIEKKEEWVGLKAIAKIESERYIKVSGKVETEIRYYICSIENAQVINHAVRKHWGVENKLHWTLDMSFHEDQNRTRTKYAAQNCD